MNKKISRAEVSIAFFTLLVGVGAAVALPYASFSEAVLWPLRILTTLVHEGSHGLVAVVTGGDIASIIIRRDGSGTLSHFGGLRMLVLFAGYLGTGLFGFLLLSSAMNVHMTRFVLGVSGALFVLVVVLYGEDTFTLISGIAAGILFIGIALKVEAHITMFLSAFLGANIVMNAISDQVSLVLMSGNGFTKTDAGYMASEFGMPATFWALCWMALSLYFLIRGSRMFLARVFRT